VDHRRFKNENGIDLSKDVMALQAAERGLGEGENRAFTRWLETEINLPFVTADASGPKHLRD